MFSDQQKLSLQLCLRINKIVFLCVRIKKKALLARGQWLYCLFLFFAPYHFNLPAPAYRHLHEGTMRGLKPLFFLRLVEGEADK